MNTDRVLVFNITSREAGTRLDVFISRKLGCSRRKAVSLVNEKSVSINGRIFGKGVALKEGDSVRIEVHEPGRARTGIQGLPPPAVLMDRSDTLFVDKPAGVHCHPLRPDETPTLFDAVVSYYPEVAEAGPDAREGGLVNRLDRDTSGVLVFAKTKERWRALRSAFREHAVKKEYLALVHGTVEKGFTVDLPIARHRRDKGRMVVVDSIRKNYRGKQMPAETICTPVLGLGRYTLVRVSTFSGRMHQVRIHLAHAGHPIAGDDLYSDPDDLRPPGLARQFLHASLVEVPHDALPGGARVRSPLARDLVHVLQALKARK